MISSTRTPVCALIASVLFCCALANSSKASPVYDNSDHTMAAGSFGVIFHDGTNIYHWDGIVGNKITTEIAGVNPGDIAAANLDGTGNDEIVYSSGGVLFTYDFVSSTNQGGSGIIDLTAGDFNNTGADVVLVAANAAGDKFLWRPGAGYQVISDPGSLGHRVFAGETNAADAGQEFMSAYVVGSGEVNNGRLISGEYTGPVPSVSQIGLGGSGIRDMSTGNLLNNGGNGQVWLNQDANIVFIWDIDTASFIDPGIGNATQMATADLDSDGTDFGYWIDITSGSIMQYDAIALSVSTLPGANNFGFNSLLSADLDGNGSDELYALKDDPNLLFRFTAGALEFQIVSVPEPSGMLLAMLSGIGIAVAIRRRR